MGLYSYKISKNNHYRNPHAIPLHLKNQYKAQGYRGELKIREIERNGDRPFGKFTRKGKFMFNIEKVPFFNIPDLTGFKVKLTFRLSLLLIVEAICFPCYSKDLRR